MGTRADYYVGRGINAEWLGSTAWDGCPTECKHKILEATNEKAYRAEVERHITSRDDGTKPQDGWPWPWPNSQTTDYAYCFVDGRVEHYGFGHLCAKTGDPGGLDEDDYAATKSEFPDMTAVQNVTLGSRSGVMVLKI